MTYGGGCAARLINSGVSAETLKLIMRHRNFATTERFYASRSAQSAAEEVRQKLSGDTQKSALVGRLVGRNEQATQLSTEELQKLKRLLNSI